MGERMLEFMKLVRRPATYVRGALGTCSESQLKKALSKHLFNEAASECSRKLFISHLTDENTEACTKCNLDSGLAIA